MKKTQILYSNTNEQITELLRNSLREANDENQVILYNNNNNIDSDLSIRLTDRDVNKLRENLDILEQASRNPDFNNTEQEAQFVDNNISYFEEFPVLAKKNENLFSNNSIIDEGVYKESFAKVFDSLEVGPVSKAIKEDSREVFLEKDIESGTNENHSMHNIINFKEGVLAIDFNQA